MGNGNNSRGCTQGGRRGNQCNCRKRGIRNGGRGNVQLGREVDHVYCKAWCYTFQGKNEAEMSDTFITCTILFCDLMADVFNLGATYSYIYRRFDS